MFFWQDTFGFSYDAISDEVPVCIDGMGGETQLSEGCVGRVCDVSEGVEQCAVEIEYNSFEFDLKLPPQLKLICLTNC